MTAAFHSSHSADLDPVVAAIIAQLQEKAAVQERVIGEKDAQLMRSRQALQTTIEFIIRKYADALPLYRQRAMLLRDLGIDVALTTIDDAVLRVGEQLITIVDVMKRDLLTGGYIQADDRGPHGQVFVRGVSETHVDVQTPDKKGENHRGFFWQYSAPSMGVVFDFEMTRGKKVAKEFFKDYGGILHTDG